MDEEIRIFANGKRDDGAIGYKLNELYREIELFHNGTKIGEAEIDIEGHMLAKLVIFEPYQDKGYGTKIVKALTYKYDLKDLWVNADNARAIHVYEKCGYKIEKPTMFKMVRYSSGTGTCQ